MPLKNKKPDTFNSAKKDIVYNRQMQAGTKNIEQPELLLPDYCWEGLLERKNNQEFVRGKDAISIEHNTYISDFLSAWYYIPMAGMTSLSSKSGFDRKIYLHNITEESGTKAKNSDFQDLLKGE